MDVWSFTAEGFDPARAALDGNRFLCANGYLGLRGTVEEAGAEALPAINLAGVYDRQGSGWREPVNAPRCLFVRCSADGEAFALGEKEPVSHRVTIDYRRGLFRRDTDFGALRLTSERFVSMADCHLLADRLTVTAARACRVSLCAGISAELWDINGPHLFDWRFGRGEALTAEAVTGELGITVSAAQCLTAEGADIAELPQKPDGVFREVCWTLQPGESRSLTLFAAVYTSLDLPAPGEAARACCLSARTRGWEACLATHEAASEAVWARSAVELSGDPEAERALHASQFYLNSIAPRHADDLSIPARGLSGQTYKGAIFWDSEMFFFPMFVHTQPEVAESLLRYRIRTLPGALRKAAEYGFRGAFYAWESQEGGKEGCSDFNVVDVFTHRPVRTYFRDKQIHISGDIAFAFRSHYEITGDRGLLRAGGAEVILQCARFYLSRAAARLDSDAVDFADVIGPDEYHERVTNNAFTNRVIRHCLESALLLRDIFADEPAFLDSLLSALDYRHDWALLETLLPRIRRPRANKDGVLEQFDGYFALEDCRPDTVRSRLCDAREYWGGDHGVAGPTQVIKQADVIALAALFPQDFTAESLAANYAYYEPRTEHGSSLSACMYALAACRIGRLDEAWRLFLRTASIDLAGGGKEWAGEIYIGGTHPAANGGAWMIAALGFAGLQVRGGKAVLQPNLPPQLRRLRFPITAGGKRLLVTVTQAGSEIREAD